MNIQNQNLNQVQPPQIVQVQQNAPAGQEAIINQQAQPVQAQNQQQNLQPQLGQSQFIGQQQRVGLLQGNQVQYAQHLQAPPRQRNIFFQPPQINMDLFKNNNQMKFERIQGQQQDDNRNNIVQDANNVPFDQTINKEHIQKMLDRILEFNLHLDSDYTSIYGILQTVKYLQDAKNRFTIAYYHLIQFIQLNDKLTRWYEMVTKEFHLKYGISTVLDPNWLSLTQNISVLAIRCTLTLNHSDPATNFTLLMNKYYSHFNQYRDAIKDQEEQQVLRNVLQHLSSKESIDIYSIFQMSALGGLNIMVHQNMIPAQHPILIMNGKEVTEDQFPKYNILQLFTLNRKLYYGISLIKMDKQQLDQYIHYEVKIQHIDYTEEAEQVLNNMKLKEEKIYQQALAQSQTDRLNHLKEICKNRPANQGEQGPLQAQNQAQNDNQVQHPLQQKPEENKENKNQQEESKEQWEFYDLDGVEDEQIELNAQIVNQ